MEPDDPDGRKPALLSLRSAFVLTLALFVALAAGVLLYAAHRSIALAVLGAGGAFAAAVTFFNLVIELRSTMPSRRLPPSTVRGLPHAERRPSLWGVRRYGALARGDRPSILGDMTLRTYWCVLQQAERRRSGKLDWTDTDGFNCDLDLDLDGGPLSGLRAALVTRVLQLGGDETAVGWYRLNVFDAQGDLRVRDYVAPPDFPVPASLADYTDGQLIAELARRLNGR